MLDSGELYICTLTDTAEPGMKPAPRLAPEEEPRTYERRRFWYGRTYADKGAKERIDAVYRIWDDTEDTVRIGMYVLTTTGNQYQIDDVRPDIDKHGHPVLDLKLSRVEDYYDIAE